MVNFIYTLADNLETKTSKAQECFQYSETNCCTKNLLNKNIYFKTSLQRFTDGKIHLKISRAIVSDQLSTSVNQYLDVNAHKHCHWLSRLSLNGFETFHASMSIEKRKADVVFSWQPTEQFFKSKWQVAH